MSLILAHWILEARDDLKSSSTKCLILELRIRPWKVTVPQLGSEVWSESMLSDLQSLWDCLHLILHEFYQIAEWLHVCQHLLVCSSGSVPVPLKRLEGRLQRVASASRFMVPRVFPVRLVLPAALWAKWFDRYLLPVEIHCIQWH